MVCVASVCSGVLDCGFDVCCCLPGGIDVSNVTLLVVCCSTTLVVVSGIRLEIPVAVGISCVSMILCDGVVLGTPCGCRFVGVTFVVTGSSLVESGVVDVVGGCCCVRFLLTLVLRGSGCCVTPTAPLSPSGRLSFLNWVFLEPLLQVARSGCHSGTSTVVDIVGLCVLWSCKFRTRSLQSTL